MDPTVIGDPTDAEQDDVAGFNVPRLSDGLPVSRAPGEPRQKREVVRVLTEVHDVGRQVLNLGKPGLGEQCRGELDAIDPHPAQPGAGVERGAVPALAMAAAASPLLAPDF